MSQAWTHVCKEKLSSALLETRGRLAALREWVRPLDRVATYCREGHSQLNGWATCPDCRLAAPTDSLGGEQVLPIQMFLVRSDRLVRPFCLTEGVSRIGNTPDCDHLVAEVVEKPIGPFQIEAKGSGVVEIKTLGSARLEINSRGVLQATLYDGDELLLDGTPYVAVVPPEGKIV